MGYYILLPPFIPLFKWRMEPRIEVWPATLCPAQTIPSLHIGGRGGTLPPHSLSSQGVYGHSLSVLDNGRKLVACGGRDYTKAGGFGSDIYRKSIVKTFCISWRIGQDGWRRELNMM